MSTSTSTKSTRKFAIDGCMPRRRSYPKFGVVVVLSSSLSPSAVLVIVLDIVVVVVVVVAITPCFLVSSVVWLAGVAKSILGGDTDGCTARQVVVVGVMEIALG